MVRFLHLSLFETDIIYATARNGSAFIARISDWLSNTPSLPIDLGCQREEANCMFLTTLIGAEDTSSCLISSVL